MTEETEQFEPMEQRIKQIRKQKEMTIMEVARKVEISPAYLSRIETGGVGSATLKTIVNIVDALDVTMAELLGEAEKKSRTYGVRRVFGNRIRRKRKSQGLTITTLAEKAEISTSYLSRLETGVADNPSLGILSKIALALNTTLRELLV